MKPSVPNFKSIDVSKLYVVTCISNPQRYGSRYFLYKQFQEHMAKSGVKLMTVELALGDRAFEITEPGNPLNLQLRTYDEIWHKENMINLGIQRLPEDWQYVAWIDADTWFEREDWAAECIHQLQHYMFIQMFQTAVDYGPTGQALQIHQSFMHQWEKNGRKIPYNIENSYTNGWHPGFAWAARREAFEGVGKLFDVAILGSGDRHMAHCMIEDMRGAWPGDLSKNYQQSILEWFNLCKTHIRKDVGCMPGTLGHGWHGKKVDRRYQDRWKILKNNEYDPLTDLKLDWQGLWAWTGNKPKLRDDVRVYFRQRNEDSIELA